MRGRKFQFRAGSALVADDGSGCYWKRMIYKLTWILVLILLAGCASEFARHDVAETTTREQQADSRKNAFPTFTYRPGS